MDVMSYLEIAIELSFIQEETVEILIARLSELGFDGFWNEQNMLKAYIDENLFDKNIFETVLNETLSTCKYKTEIMPDKNWNEQWEKSYEPVIIENKCIIKAPFHEISQKFPLEIIVSPKMAFGTGHHHTTQLIIEQLFNIDLINKTIIDAGCGSGVLAIAAEKLGAESILAFDIDHWSVENTTENIELNQCSHIIVKQGTIDEVKPDPSDIILANINRNILLSEMESYQKFLKNNGLLILSGFIESDVEIIKKSATNKGLFFQNSYSKKDWYCLVFKKN